MYRSSSLHLYTLYTFYRCKDVELIPEGSPLHLFQSIRLYTLYTFYTCRYARLENDSTLRANRPEGEC